MEKLLKSFCCLAILLSANVFANVEDRVPVLGDDPTEEQIELVRQGARSLCHSIEDINSAEQCVYDYYAEHNLDEEPSCDG